MLLRVSILPAAMGTAATLALVAAPTGARAAPEGAAAAASASSSSSDAEDEPGKQPLAWHGTTLLFDQSVTTQTLRVGDDYQSANPTYEWWLAFKPRYFLHETKASSISLNLWANLYLELTDSDTTTSRREPVGGPTYVWATYTRTLRDGNGYKTALALGPRVTIPTDKAARNAGHIMGGGGILGVSQSVPLRGGSARVFRGARLGVTAIYNHPFSRATSGVNDDIRWTRVDTGLRPIVSDQLTGRMFTAHALNLAFSADLQLLRRLSLSVSYVLLNAWVYGPSRSDCIAELTGCYQPLEVDSPTTYKVNTWGTAAVSYDALDDLSVSLGYYNLASQIGPDGTYRNPLWSPSARFFLTFTANLDVAYARLSGKKK
jgi:hypothetical protein